MRLVPIVLLFSLCCVLRAAGQDFAPSVRLRGDLRIRSEIDSRDFNLSTPPNTFTTMRTRFGLEAFPAEKIRVLVIARDWRVFGTETDAAGSFNTISDGKNVDLHQGYIEVTDFLADGLLLRAGRQELSFSNERMIGGVGWNNIGRVFDGGLLRLKADAVTVDLFGMKVAEVRAYTAAATPASTAPVRDDGQNFFGLYAQWQGGGGHKVDGYLLYQGNRMQSGTGFIDFRRVTTGAYAMGKVGAFLYETEVALQAGERGAADIAAYTLTGMVGYEFSGASVSRVAAGYEYLSGTPAGDPDFKSFDPPYATGHKFHGFMDYFTNIPLHTGNLGLADLLGRLDFRMGDRLTGGAWYHQFRAAQRSGGESLLGHEVDLLLKYQYAKALSFEAGISSFLPGPLMRAEFDGADTGLWGFLATTVTF